LDAREVCFSSGPRDRVDSRTRWRRASGLARGGDHLSVEEGIGATGVSKRADLLRRRAVLRTAARLGERMPSTSTCPAPDPAHFVARSASAPVGLEREAPRARQLGVVELAALVEQRRRAVVRGLRSCGSEASSASAGSSTGLALRAETIAADERAHEPGSRAGRLVARDAAVVWHGFTQMSCYGENAPVIVERARAAS